MKVNDIYICRFPMEDAPGGSAEQIVIIRRLTPGTVTFSALADEQLRISEGMLQFSLSAFTVGRPQFTELFEPFGEGIPFRESEVLQ